MPALILVELSNHFIDSFIRIRTKYTITFVEISDVQPDKKSFRAVLATASVLRRLASDQALTLLPHSYPSVAKCLVGAFNTNYAQLRLASHYSGSLTEFFAPVSCRH
jgi:hypothetical protein